MSSAATCGKHSGASRTAFRGRPESVRLQPGILFGFTPESCSTCPGMLFGLPRNTHELIVLPSFSCSCVVALIARWTPHQEPRQRGATRGYKTLRTAMRGRPGTLAAHQSSWALRIPEANSPPERGHNHSGTGRNTHGTAPLLWWHDANYTFPERYTKNPIWAQELCVLAFFALKSAIISRLKAGRSEGCRLLIQLRSRTTSRSTHWPPELRMSSWMV